MLPAAACIRVPNCHQVGQKRRAAPFTHLVAQKRRAAPFTSTPCGEVVAARRAPTGGAVRARRAPTGGAVQLSHRLRARFGTTLPAVSSSSRYDFQPDPKRSAPPVRARCASRDVLPWSPHPVGRWPLPAGHWPEGRNSLSQRPLRGLVTPHLSGLALRAGTSSPAARGGEPALRAGFCAPALTGTRVAPPALCAGFYATGAGYAPDRLISALASSRSFKAAPGSPW